MEVYSLVHIGRDTFLMLNAKEDLKIKHCNSNTFRNVLEEDLDTNVFEYYGLKVDILIDKLDRRTKRFKQFEKDYQYFSVSFLPKIKERSLNSVITGNYKFK